MSTADPRSTTARRTARAAALAGLLAIAACGDGSSDVPVATDAPGETTLDPADPGAATDTADAGAGGPTDTGVPTSPADGSTTSLAPSAEADLPTAPPTNPGDSEPTTTLATGPLPVPSVDLLPIGDFDSPVGTAVRPSDPRLFVVEQAGRVLAVDDENAAEVLDASARIASGGERGLLGLAFHPERDLAYVDFTDLDGNTVIAEYAVDPETAVFDPDSFREVLTVEQPFGNHNGGALLFGPDELLYIGLGDGGAADDPLRAGLDLGTRLGKILRIDPLGAGGEPFVVPADNPFVGVDGADPTIWSYGLRNPWRVSFDAATGDLWIADVGQNEFEEIDRAPAIDGRDAGKGLSFGWSAYEGDARFNEDQDPEGHVFPVVTYSHEDGDCSVSGGVVARDAVVVDLDGWYLYGDFCSGTIWGYDTTSPADAPVVVELAELPALTAVAAGPDGEFYAVSNSGTVARLATGA